MSDEVGFESEWGHTENEKEGGVENNKRSQSGSQKKKVK
jgi:hypothetical protein